MSVRNRENAKKVAKTGARGVSGVISLILKIIGTILLVGITSAVIFACIFVIYIKTNLTSQLDISLEDYTMNLTSMIYYTDPDTGEQKEMTPVQTSEKRTWIDYKDIPLDVEHALVAIEDQRFYTHDGVDWFRTISAFVNMFVGMKNTYGGSTITQQLIKNVTEYDDVTVQRKLIEIFRALELEKTYEKDQIIEWYLNKVYFGHGRYGIGAASTYYFAKEVDELSLAEIASIIAITNNPSMFSPYVNEKQNKERQELVLYKMYEQGYISETQYKSAIAEKLVFQKGENEDANATAPYTYFEDALISDVLEAIMEQKNCTKEDASHFLSTGGYQIYATINPEIQECVDQIYTNLEEIPTTTGTTQQLQSAIVIIDPYTGNIVALSGGVGEKTESRIFNRATQARRSPGSSVKPIASYAIAMDLNYITPETLFYDDEAVILNGTDWMTKNDDRKYNGVVNIRYALQRSINTVAAQIVDQITPTVSYNFLKYTLGFDLDPADEAYAPMAVGQFTYGATVREMATAYTMFPNDGIWTESRTFTAIYDSEGNLFYENEPETKLAISETTAYWMTDMLRNAVRNGTGAGAYMSEMPVAGKTGTSGSSNDRWFVGYTPYYVAAVWCGYDVQEPIRGVSGNPASALWKKVMTLVHEGLEYREFSKPENTYLAPVQGVEEIEYVVRGVDELGQVLYESLNSGVSGYEVSAEATPLENYELTSAAEIVIVLFEDGENIIEFTYRSLEPEEPEDPDPSDNPDNPPDVSPGTSDNPDDPTVTPPDVSPSVPPSTPPDGQPDNPDIPVAN